MNPMLLRRGLSVSALTFAGLLSLTSLAQAMKVGIGALHSVPAVRANHPGDLGEYRCNFGHEIDGVSMPDDVNTRRPTRICNCHPHVSTHRHVQRHHANKPINVTVRN